MASAPLPPPAPAGPLEGLRALAAAADAAWEALPGAPTPSEAANRYLDYLAADDGLGEALRGNLDLLLACAAVVESLRTGVPLAEADADALRPAYPAEVLAGLGHGLAAGGALSPDGLRAWLKGGGEDPARAGEAGPDVPRRLCCPGCADWLDAYGGPALGCAGHGRCGNLRARMLHGVPRETPETFRCPAHRPRGPAA